MSPKIADTNLASEFEGQDIEAAHLNLPDEPLPVVEKFDPSKETSPQEKFNASLDMFSAPEYAGQRDAQIAQMDKDAANLRTPLERVKIVGAGGQITETYMPVQPATTPEDAARQIAEGKQAGAVPQQPATKETPTPPSTGPIQGQSQGGIKTLYENQKVKFESEVLSRVEAHNKQKEAEKRFNQTQRDSMEARKRKGKNDFLQEQYDSYAPKPHVTADSDTVVSFMNARKNNDSFDSTLQPGDVEYLMKDRTTRDEFMKYKAEEIKLKNIVSQKQDELMVGATSADEITARIMNVVPNASKSMAGVVNQEAQRLAKLSPSVNANQINDMLRGISDKNVAKARLDAATSVQSQADALMGEGFKRTDSVEETFKLAETPLAGADPATRRKIKEAQRWVEGARSQSEQWPVSDNKGGVHYVPTGRGTGVERKPTIDAQNALFSATPADFAPLVNKARSGDAQAVAAITAPIYEAAKNLPADKAADVRRLVADMVSPPYDAANIARSFTEDDGLPKDKQGAVNEYQETQANLMNMEADANNLVQNGHADNFDEAITMLIGDPDAKKRYGNNGTAWRDAIKTAYLNHNERSGIEALVKIQSTQKEAEASVEPLVREAAAQLAESIAPAMPKAGGAEAAMASAVTSTLVEMSKISIKDMASAQRQAGYIFFDTLGKNVKDGGPLAQRRITELNEEYNRLGLVGFAGKYRAEAGAISVLALGIQKMGTEDENEWKKLNPGQTVNPGEFIVKDGGKLFKADEEVASLVTKTSTSFVKLIGGESSGKIGTMLDDGDRVITNILAEGGSEFDLKARMKGYAPQTGFFKQVNQLVSGNDQKGGLVLGNATLAKDFMDRNKGAVSGLAVEDMKVGDKRISDILTKGQIDNIRFSFKEADKETDPAKALAMYRVAAGYIVSHSIKNNLNVAMSHMTGDVAHRGMEQLTYGVERQPITEAQVKMASVFPVERMGKLGEMATRISRKMQDANEATGNWDMGGDKELSTYPLVLSIIMASSGDSAYMERPLENGENPYQFLKRIGNVAIANELRSAVLDFNRTTNWNALTLSADEQTKIMESLADKTGTVLWNKTNTVIDNLTSVSKINDPDGQSDPRGKYSVHGKETASAAGEAMLIQAEIMRDFQRNPRFGLYYKGEAEPIIVSPYQNLMLH